MDAAQDIRKSSLRLSSSAGSAWRSRFFLTAMFRERGDELRRWLRPDKKSKEFLPSLSSAMDIEDSYL